MRDTAHVRVPQDYPWKVLDGLINDHAQCLSKDDLSIIRGIARKRDINAYLELSETWGPQSITPNSGVSIATFATKYQLCSLLKKFQFPGGSETRRTAAMNSFLAAEEACTTFNIVSKDELAFLIDPNELSAYTYARQFLSRLLGEELPSREVLTLWSRHGPGSNLDTLDRAVSPYDKYSNWPYSCTDAASRVARLTIQDDERWLGALEDSYRVKHSVPKHEILDQEVFWSNVLKVVPGNRICFVPKNSRTDRSIAIEPCMNLYLQLGVDGFIRRRLKRWDVDLDSQLKNQELARLGSLNWECEDSYATLDLKAASDSISTELCRLLLPPQWYSYLMQLRSPVGDLDGDTIVYSKVSSMGNGYTFALQSAIFTSLIYGVERTLRKTFEPEHVAIFGDDLIVRRRSVPLLIRMLSVCGLQINEAKSFFEGPFRESCGADWHSGAPVRPVFLNTNPTTAMELWGDHNRLLRSCNLRFLGYKFEVTKLIMKWSPVALNGLRGPCSDEDFNSYVHCPVPGNPYEECCWEFPRLVVTPNGVRGDNFLFRKLMHSLRAEPVSAYSSFLWGGVRVAGVGSRFTVTRSNSVTVSLSFSKTSHWSKEYNATIVSRNQRMRKVLFPFIPD